MQMLAAAVALAQRAGKLLVELQSATELDIRPKADGSPVTLADRAAHELLARELPNVGPYLVFSEESGPADIADRRQSERVWIVDPLDGTRDYLRGSSEFAVSIALVENGVPVLGVIDAPRLGVTYYAQRGGGAFRLAAGGRPESISCAQTLDERRIVVSRADVDVNWSTVPSLRSARVEGISSAVKFGFVAEGSAVAYPRLTPSSEWDIAAGHALLIEAGARVVGVDGRDLTYNKVNSLNPPFLATGCRQIAAASASILALPRSSSRPVFPPISPSGQDG